MSTKEPKDRLNLNLRLTQEQRDRWDKFLALAEQRIPYIEETKLAKELLKLLPPKAIKKLTAEDYAPLMGDEAEIHDARPSRGKK